LFEEGTGATQPTAIEIAARGTALETSETKPANAGGVSKTVAPAASDQGQASASTLEISRFCAAIRVGTPLACGPERAFHSAQWTLAANEALKTKALVKIA
jgi:hypothetical protein